MKLIKKSDVFSNFITDMFEDSIENNPFKKNVLPAVNISETDNEYLIDVCAPGIKKEDIKLKIENEFLTISYEVEKKTEEKEKNYFKKEFSYNSFQRKTHIPKDVIVEKIDATFNDGILNIKLPRDKVKKEDTKEILIK